LDTAGRTGEWVSTDSMPSVATLSLADMPPAVLEPEFHEFTMSAPDHAVLALHMDSQVLVNGMNGTAEVDKPELRPFLVRTARSWTKILGVLNSNPSPAMTFMGMSPLMWVRRSFNVQADFLCHYTLGIRASWRKTYVTPNDFRLDIGECLVAWSDGGFDGALGGTAAYLIAVRKDQSWHVLAAGGVYDGMVSGNDALRMEAIGMEKLMERVSVYLCNCQ